MSERGTALERDTLTIRGVRSELRLEGGRITIVKEATTQASPTQVSVDVTEVRAATMDPPRRGGRGWLHVATVNGSPAPVGELAASGDPYALPITARSVPACRRLVKMVERHVKERGLPADAGPNQGRYSSGVVLSSPVPPAQPVRAVATDEVGYDEPEVDSTPPTPKPPPRKSTAKKATAKKATKKKTTRARATAERGTSAPAADQQAAVAAELVTHLKELAGLHDAGVLTDEEFTKAKARILG